MRSSLLFPLFFAFLLMPSSGLADINEQRPDRKKEEAPKEPQLTKAPALIEFVEAEYPSALLQEGIGGEVLMVVDIDITGGPNCQRVDFGCQG